MSSERFYRVGRTHLEGAVTADEQKDYERAKRLYLKAAENFLLGIRCDKDVNRRTTTIVRVKNYISRAEAVNSILEKNKSKKGKTKRAKSSSNEDDEERGFDKIAGMEHVKQSMREAVILPKIHPQLFTGKRVPWKGILLFGPPGTGKTFLAQALSEEADVEFVSVSSSDIVSKFQGESERAIKAIFENARKSKKPTVIFIDEVDSIGGSRDTKNGSNAEASRRLLTELLKQMDGVGSADRGITVIGATNHAEEIDSALRRRFEKRLYVPLPGIKSRLRIFELNFGTDKSLHSLSRADYIKLAKITKGYSAADITTICNEALMMPIRECLRSGRLWSLPPEKVTVPRVNFGHVRKAVQKVKPSVSSAEIKRHEDFAAKFSGEPHVSRRLREEEAAEETELMQELSQPSRVKQAVNDLLGFSWFPSTPQHSPEQPSERRQIGS